MDLQTKVMEIIEKNIERKAELKPETDLRADLGVDSFEMLMIVNGLEEEFSLTIPEDKVKGIATVADIVRELEANGVK